jgi:hypothetical protein
MTTDQLRREFSKEMSSIPDFINTTSTMDFMIWNSMDYLNSILLVLVRDSVMSSTKVNGLINKFEMEMESILNQYDKHLEIILYYSTMIDYLMYRTIQEEKYEASSNLKKFTDKYYKNQPI